MSTFSVGDRDTKFGISKQTYVQNQRFKQKFLHQKEKSAMALNGTKIHHQPCPVLEQYKNDNLV